MSHSIVRPVKCRRVKWTGHVARSWKTRNAFRILAWKILGKLPLETPSRLEENIKVELEIYVVIL
jgi:hypothetical protein